MGFTEESPGRLQMAYIVIIMLKMHIFGDVLPVEMQPIWRCSLKFFHSMRILPEQNATLLGLSGINDIL